MNKFDVYIRNITNTIRKEINQLPFEKLKDIEYLKAIFRMHRITVPSLRTTEIQSDIEPKREHWMNIPNGGGIHDKPYKDIEVVHYKIPYDGDSVAFTLLPSDFPNASYTDKHLIVSVTTYEKVVNNEAEMEKNMQLRNDIVTRIKGELSNFEKTYTEYKKDEESIIWNKVEDLITLHIAKNYTMKKLNSF